jgi:ABC-type Fe3+-siderophore transport system permease subunit
MPASFGATSLAVAIVGLVAVAPFLAIALVNVIFAENGWTPLTQIVENYLRRYPLFAAALAGFFGALVGHVFWSFGDNPRADPATLGLLFTALAGAAILGLAGGVLLVGIGFGLHVIATRFLRK